MQKRFDTKAPTQLLNSPTFNNLDNRFESQIHLNNNSHLQYGGLEITPGGQEEGDLEHPNVFTESQWPGLNYVESNVSEPAVGYEEKPRLVTQNDSMFDQPKEDETK